MKTGKMDRGESTRGKAYALIDIIDSNLNRHSMQNVQLLTLERMPQSCECTFGSLFVVALNLDESGKDISHTSIITSSLSTHVLSLSLSLSHSLAPPSAHRIGRMQ